MRAHFILYVKDQAASSRFYRTVLGLKPRLDVPGMTEFSLSDSTVLGLMPEESIQKLLEDMPSPKLARGVPRAELYLHVLDPEAHLNRVVANGGSLLSETALRSWGDRAGYGLDLDGHVLAFAEDAGHLVPGIRLSAPDD